MRRNPYVIALLVIGGFVLFLAVILTIVVSAMTDVTDYDVDAVGALTAWIGVLINVGIASLVGVIVVGGVAWTLRNAGFDV